MQHGEAAKLGTDHAQKKKQKLGVWLFWVYTIVYAIFVAIGVTNYEMMGKIVMGSQNLAVVFGFGLIVFAIILGIVYNQICTGYENKLNKEEDKK
ncbi:MAG: hypothetical protein C0592_06640 [Marinilabiliales bacterium]|nr:MAG: hypothetical protein C0592_06640 [Marinilabiliales bacterium]